MAIRSIEALTAKQVASITDHTFLKTEDAFAKSNLGAVRGRAAAFNEFLTEIPKLQPYAVCVRHYDVAQAVDTLQMMNMGRTKVAAVVGFPSPNKYVQPRLLHQNVIDEITMACCGHADEIDFVLPTNAFIWPIVENYVGGVHRFAKSSGLVTKMIIEVRDNSPARIVAACELAGRIGVDMVKTSTGYSNGGATVQALDLMKRNFKRGINISGGVTPENYQGLLRVASRADDGLIDLNPRLIRIGANSLLPELYSNAPADSGY